MQKFLILLCSLMIHAASAYAADKGFPTLDRPIVFEAPPGSLELWGQYDHFSTSLDYFNFASKTGTSSRIDKHDNQHLGLNWMPYDKFIVRYAYLNSTQHATRIAEPKSIDTRYTGHELRLQRVWVPDHTFYISLDAGYRTHQAKPTGFPIYQSGVYTLSTTDGSNVVSLPYSKDSAYILGLRSTMRLMKPLRLSLGMEVRKLDIHSIFDSPALNDGILGPVLLDEFPQRTPWKETHIVTTASLDWNVFKYLSLSADAQYYRIARHNYVPKAGKKDYNSNMTLDGYIFVHINPGMSVYGHGKISQRYLLGEVPLIYNTRTNHRFDNIYGFVSGGISYRF